MSSASVGPAIAGLSVATTSMTADTSRARNICETLQSTEDLSFNRDRGSLKASLAKFARYRQRRWRLAPAPDKPLQSRGFYSRTRVRPAVTKKAPHRILVIHDAATIANRGCRSRLPPIRRLKEEIHVP